MSFSELKSLLEKHNQGHLVKFWNEITEEEKENLTENIKDLNISQVNAYFEGAIAANENKTRLPDDIIKPIPKTAYESYQDASLDKLSEYEKIGLEAISKGKVAVVLLSGGQGTRLGVDYPKGMYNVNLPSKRTLFHIQALRIKRLHALSKEKFGECKGITWYIMTSDATHQSTLKYFEENNYFGIDKNNVIAFKQGTLPCFTFDGKIILDGKSSISKAPDGNGGLYTALKKEGILKDMEKRGIESVHVFSVDNILVKVADPIFIGYCITRSADCGVKVVKKRSPQEPVGVVCLVDNVYSVVEYTEISTAATELRDDRGNLIFSAGNICNHYFSTAFLNEISNISNNCDLHIAKKKIPFIDDNGVRIKPDVPNGIKIEKFIFDVFKYSKNFAVWDVLREDEFSGLKNAESAGIDCPSTARNDLLNLHKKWLLKAGAKEVDQVEICPLISYSGENLSHLAKDKILKGPLCLM